MLRTNLDVGTLIVNNAAIFWLVEMIAHTALYRKRGWLIDTMFTNMLLLDIFIAVMDIFNHVLMAYPISHKMLVLTIGNSIYFSAVLLHITTYLMYSLCLVGKEAIAYFKWKEYIFPLFFIGFVLIILNMFFGFLFTINPETYEVVRGDAFVVLIIIALMYLLQSSIQIWRTSKVLVGALFATAATRIYLAYSLESISSTAFIMAVGLSYTHICAMNQEFDTEVKS